MRETLSANSWVPWRNRHRETEPLLPSPRILNSTIPPSRAAFRQPSSSKFPISSVRESCLEGGGGVASSSPSALVDIFILPNAPDISFPFDSSPIHSLTCLPKSFSITTGLGEESSEIEGVNGTDGCREEELSEGSVLIERVGRMFARERFEAGGRREGDALLRLRERPVGILRVGGRNEGEPPLTPLTDMFYTTNVA